MAVRFHCGLESCRANPVNSIDIDEFLVKAVQRRQAWQKIEKDIPALTMIPFLCENAWENTNFSSVQRAKVENLVKKSCQFVANCPEYG